MAKHSPSQRVRRDWDVRIPKLQDVTMVHWYWCRMTAQSLDYFLCVDNEDREGMTWANRDWKLMPHALLEDDSTSSRDEITFHVAEVGISPQMLWQISPIMSGLTEEDHPRISTNANETLRHFHVSFHPPNLIIVLPVDTRHSNAALVFPISAVKRRAFLDGVIERD